LTFGEGEGAAAQLEKKTGTKVIGPQEKNQKKEKKLSSPGIAESFLHIAGPQAHEGKGESGGVIV